jgi:hypothetical protein
LLSAGYKKEKILETKIPEISKTNTIFYFMLSGAKIQNHTKEVIKFTLFLEPENSN